MCGLTIFSYSFQAVGCIGHSSVTGVQPTALPVSQCRMDHNVAWIEMSHGTKCRMDQDVAWDQMSHGLRGRMVPNVAWITTSHGPEKRNEGKYTRSRKLPYKVNR